MKPRELLAAERAEILTCAGRLLDQTAVKLSLTPIGVALDVDFLKTVVLFVSAVQEHLLDVGAHDTLPPPPADATMRVSATHDACTCDWARGFCPIHDPNVTELE